MFKKISIEDRIKGCFVGLAIGDALGAPVEFEPKNTYPWVDDFLPVPYGGLQAGDWTDDTAMALCMANALYGQKGYDSFSIMDEYVNWWREGKYTPNGQCYGIGEQTVDAVDEYRRDKTFLTPVTNGAGNGCIMRLAPISIVSLNTDSQVLRDLLAKTSCQETHNNLEAIQATIFFNRLLANLLSGESKRKAFKNACVDFQDDFGLIKFLKEANNYNVDGDGYVRVSLQAAWYYFNSTDNFKAAIEKAVNGGGDTDTIGAITGQLAGAFYGYSRIPLNWREKVFDRDYIELCAIDLQKVSATIIKARKFEEPYRTSLPELN